MLRITNDYYNNPIVLEKSQENIAGYDIFSRLLQDRIIFLGTDIDDDVANVIIAQLLFLDSQSHDPIKMYINSPGGVVTSGLAIYDTMQLVKSPIHTVCVGQCASMGAVLLSAGDKRFSLPHSRIMIHQPSGGGAGQSSDIQIVAKEIERMKNQLNEILSHHTGQSIKKIVKDSDRDFWMSADEALAYGIIDKIIANEKE